MAEVPVPKEKWSGKIAEVSIAEGLSVGGEKGMPFLSYEGLGKRQLIAGEVTDTDDVPPEEQADAWQKDGNAELICLKLLSADPEGADASPEDAVKTVRKVLDAVSLPVIVYGCGNESKDPKILEAVSSACASKRIIIGQATENTYKTVASAAASSGHGLVAFSNLDINLAKQMNILLTDFGVKLDSVIMDTLMAGLGTGLEYSYSVNERIRIAALMNDRMLQLPMICDVTSSLSAREVTEENSEWGDLQERTVWWETAAALSALMSGADIVIMRNRSAAASVSAAITELRGE